MDEQKTAVEEPDDKYAKLEDAAADQIDRYCGTSKDYLKWFQKYSPASYAQFEGFLSIVDSAHGILPIRSFETLLGIHVAWCRHIHALYLDRNELQGLKLPTPGGPVM